MAARPTMKDALSTAAGKPAPRSAQPAPAEPSALPAVASEPVRKRQASREGLRNLSVHVHPSVHAQLGHMAIDMGRPKEDLMRQALNLLFELHGRPPIA